MPTATATTTETTRRDPADLSTDFTRDDTEILANYLLSLWDTTVRTEGRTARAANIHTAWLAADMANYFLTFRSGRVYRHRAAALYQTLSAQWASIADYLLDWPEDDATAEAARPFLARVCDFFSLPHNFA